MNQDLSIFTLVTQASLVVQLVMAGLLIASLASWTVIFVKIFGLKRVRGDNEEFEREFWAGRNLNELYADAAKRTDGAPMERIFASGMREFLKLRERRVADPGALLDGARRAMRASFQREVDAVSTDDAILAGLVAQDPYLHIVGPNMAEQPYGIGVNLTNTPLVRFVNGTLERIRNDGTWNTLYRKWLTVLGPAPTPPEPRYSD